MKKSLIALATLTAFAGAASAQSSVVMGGFVDLGVGKNTGTADKGIQDGGGTGGSRLNFNAKEDLGGGLKAIAGFETRFRPDDGRQGNTTSFWDGYSFVGMEGGFGKVMLGRQYTPSFIFVQNKVDPFRGDTVATLRQASLQIAPETVRFGNAIRYDFTAGGFGFSGMIAEKGKTNRGDTAAIPKKPFSIAGWYGAGPLWVGVSYIKPGTTNGKLMNAGITYALGALTLRGGLANGTNDADAKVKGYLLGATYDVGSGQFKVGYATNKTANVTNSKRFAIGYQYDLSKRTFLYTDFVRDSKLATQKTGYDFGIRHNF